ncbi:MAG: hypothetical protein IIC20_03085, partial [Chloroflexi bacterium]|nr:hypothetical protein [Chloroflexota bacterium]
MRGSLLSAMRFFDSIAAFRNPLAGSHRRVALLLFAIALALLAAGCRDVDFVVGILEPDEGDAVEEARTGFLEALSDAGFKAGENARFLRRNAEFRDEPLQKLARDLIENEEVDYLFAIGTPALQAAIGGAIIEPVDAGNELTIGDLLATINAAGDGKFDASIAADGERIIFHDNTLGTATFEVRQLNDSTVADALGLGDAVGNEITGGRLISGLKTSLLSSLSGGSGLGTLGNLILTDRSNATSIVDLSTAETLDDVIELINTAQSGIVASINGNRSGLLLSDVTGAAASNLIVANGGGGAPAADLLGITADTNATSVVGSDLHLQTVSQ